MFRTLLLAIAALVIADVLPGFPPSRAEDSGALRRGLAVALAEAGSLASPDVPRVLPAGKLPDDRRLGPLKDLNGYFPFTPEKNPQAWKERAEYLRKQVRVALGLWPMPDRTPPNAVVHGKVDRDEYTVERVYFESFPGHYVTGSLYRPKGKRGRVPAVLSPHGHWPNGRFLDFGPKEIKAEIVSGAERFEGSGRHPLQARAVQLARMGAIVFHYDMIGYADSVQLTHELAHKFAKQRPHMNGAAGWGFFSPRAELRLQSIMGLQTYNSIRALDWLLELPDVDPDRIGVTGASGGGTQTFILSAIDERPAVLFPAVMVSTAMQGGCTCENACYLRVGTGNVELAALTAPRPLGMTAADDWTKEFATKGFPDLQRHYEMLGAKDRVMLKPLTHFGHNYNAVSRMVMYGWMNRFLKLGADEPVVERDFQPLTVAEATVWDAPASAKASAGRHPRPSGGEDYERKLLREIASASDRQIAALTPSDRASLDRYRAVVGGAVDVMVGREMLGREAIDAEKVGEQDRSGYHETRMLVRHKSAGEELPLVVLQPTGAARLKPGSTKSAGSTTPAAAVLWIHPSGKAGLFDAAGAPTASVRRLLDAGLAVAGVDLLYQGEFLKDGKPLTRAPKVENPREFAGYTWGYNPPLFAERVRDILTVSRYLREQYGSVRLIGLGGAAHWVAAARAQAGDAIERAAIDTAGFRFDSVDRIDHPDLWPGAVKYGDLPALIALSAPHPTWVAGETDASLHVAAAAYRVAGQPRKLVISRGERAAIDWIVR